MFDSIKKRFGRAGDARGGSGFPRVAGMPDDDAQLAEGRGPRRGSSEQDVLVRTGAGLALEPLEGDELSGRLEAAINVAMDTRDMGPVISLVNMLADAERLNVETARLIMRRIDCVYESKCAAVDMQVIEKANAIIPEQHRAAVLAATGLDRRADELERQIAALEGPVRGHRARRGREHAVVKPVE